MQSCVTGAMGDGVESTPIGAASDASGNGVTGCGQPVSIVIMISPPRKRMVISLGGLDVDDEQRLGLI